MTTREDALMNLNQQFPQLLTMKFLKTQCLVTFDSYTRNDRVAVDVPFLEETVEMSCENSQGWITEKRSSQSHLVHDEYDSAKR